jgi:hypothetical protein
METNTGPGFGVMEPEMVKEEPMLTELEVNARETIVDGRVKVVEAVNVLSLVTV